MYDCINHIDEVYCTGSSNDWSNDYYNDQSYGDWWSDSGYNYGTPSDNLPSEPGNGGSGESYVPGSNINDEGGVLSNFKSKVSEMIRLMPSTNNPAQDHYLDVLKDMQSIMDRIEDSSLPLDIIESPNVNDKMDGFLSYDQETKRYFISLDENASIDLIGHELKHVEQLMDGALYYDSKTNDIGGYDLNNEVEAYQTQNDLDHGILSGFYDLEDRYVESGDYKVTQEDVINHSPEYYGNLPRK